MYKTPQKTNEPADIVIYRQGQGILLKETSLLAYDTTTQKILAIGKEAERLLDHPHENVALCCPLHQGAITDFFAASRLFMGLLRMAFGKSPLSRPEPEKSGYAISRLTSSSGKPRKNSQSSIKNLRS